jgi:hypothetical protein
LKIPFKHCWRETLLRELAPLQQGQYNLRRPASRRPPKNMVYRLSGSDMKAEMIVPPTEWGSGTLAPHSMSVDLTDAQTLPPIEAPHSTSVDLTDAQTLPPIEASFSSGVGGAAISLSSADKCRMIHTLRDFYR